MQSVYGSGVVGVPIIAPCSGAGAQMLVIVCYSLSYLLEVLAYYSTLSLCMVRHFQIALMDSTQGLTVIHIFFPPEPDVLFFYVFTNPMTPLWITWSFRDISSLFWRSLVFFIFSLCTKYVYFFVVLCFYFSNIWHA